MIKSNLRTSLTRGGFVAASVLAGSMLLCGTGCSSDAQMLNSWGMQNVDSLVNSVETIAAQSHVINVTGTDSLNAVPDVADISMGVYVQKDTAVECQDEAADLIDAINAALKEAGVPEDQISTSNLNMYPMYDYSTNVATINGYRIDVSVEVKKIPVESIGSIISVATGAGANTVNGVSYYCSDYDAYYQEALAKAYSQAQAKAVSLAETSGCVVGNAVSITEGRDNQSYRYVNGSAYDSVMVEEASAAAFGAEQKSIAIDPGTVKISATVTVAFEIFDA
ncbi:MAG: SIMPL domain-containing protein [Coriobacteriales bacterium]|nr:SIMPL domain-containing protein [Coriobacteriales bacterium]